MSPTTRCFLLLILVMTLQGTARSNPQSRPYIALRVSPYDAEHRLEFPEDKTRSSATPFDRIPSTQCPLQFSLGISKRWHKLENTPAFAIRQAPIVQTVFPAAGPGKQVLYTTQYEHLDLLSPAPATSAETSAMREALIQNPEYPWLWESSAFHASPIIHDVNGDGIPDVILADYDGGIYIRGLANGADGKRYSHHGQAPRLYVRRDWIVARVQEALGHHPSNGTEDVNDPYHSYFEYFYGEDNKEDVLRGMTANHLGHDSEEAEGLKERRKRQISHHREADQQESAGNDEETSSRRRLEEETPVGSNRRQSGGELERETLLDHEAVEGHQREMREEEGELRSETSEEQLDDLNVDTAATGDDLYDGDDFAYPTGDDYDRSEMEENELMTDLDDPDYGHHMVDDEYGRTGGYDDYYGHRYEDHHNDYYDEKHYIRVPPHILCTPVLAELPRPYGDQSEKNDVLFVAVSYYFDEDEFEGHRSYKRFKATDEGDETEVKRGQYVGSAIMGYNLGDFGRWGSQSHLDLSTDFSAPENATMVEVLPILEDATHMGAFALSSPTVADIDGDGVYEVLLGTSMGFVYAFEAQQLFAKNSWPVQMPFAVESRILVEDVSGDTKLELFVADVGGNIACLSHDGKVLWSRNLLLSLREEGGLRQISPMVLGDVDGDGTLDLVTTVLLNNRALVFAMNAANGRDITNFPVELEMALVNDAEQDSLGSIPQPLLVDLHSDQDFLLSYIRRNGTAYQKPSPSKSGDIPHGGRAGGLHIVQPFNKDLYIIEGGSGCTQKVSIGDRMSSTVQVEDVHGTGRLDLLIATESGNTITLESSAPYHPLNTWSNGESRQRGTQAHGYSASQGIYVHEVSRQYVDIFGVYVPITFEIFDNRPGIAAEPEKRKYAVEIRDGTSSKRSLMRAEYASTGVYTERIYVRYGPGYYTLSVILQTSHGLVYEDSFAIGYNVHFLNGFGSLLWLPLFFSFVAILVCGPMRPNWNDEELEDDARENPSLGILGRSLS